MTKYKKGKIIRGTVTGIESYGVFVSCDEYYSGLIHISEVSNDFVRDINNYVIGYLNEEKGELLCIKLSAKNRLIPR